MNIKNANAKKIKILHISHTDIRSDSRILKELHAIEDITETEIIAFGIAKDYSGFYYDQKNKFRIRLFSITSNKWRFLPKFIYISLRAFEFILRFIVSGIKLNPKIIHCHDATSLLPAFLVSIFCNSILIYDAHELESNVNGQSKLMSKLTLIMEKLAWSKINLLITVSPSIINWYKDNLGAKKSLLILNSPSLDADFQDANKSNYFRDKFNIPLDKKVFLYLGIMGRGRGIDLYLDVFKRKEIDSHIVFMGFGEFVGKIEEIALTNFNIHYHPTVPHNEVVEISKSADVGLCMIEAVSLSDYFCLPNKLFEYAFSGLFVLSSNFPDLKQVIEEYSLGKYSDLDPDELFKAIKLIETLELKNNNKDLYPLSWANQAEKLKEAYFNLLKLKNK